MKITREMLKDDIEEYKKHNTLTTQESYYLSSLELAELMYPETTMNSSYFTVTDVFEKYVGTREYDGIVAVIQKWFYGSLVKAAWCATSMCWCLAQLGLRAYTIDGKYENVYNLFTALTQGVKKGKCDIVTNVNQLKRGDIIVLNYSGNFTTTSSKHVTSFVRMENNQLVCLGGNQNDGINYRKYNSENIVGMFRPHYEKGTLKKLEDLPNG